MKLESMAKSQSWILIKSSPITRSKMVRLDYSKILIIFYKERNYIVNLHRNTIFILGEEKDEFCLRKTSSRDLQSSPISQAAGPIPRLIG